MALSPAIDAAQTQPTPDDEQQLFEDKFGQMAYQVFGSQHPDLVGSIVTFKILDSDIENGAGVASFILEHMGNFIYVPVVLADNQLKPFDMMYVKEKDIFLPLDDTWVEEVGKGLLGSLGEGTKLPDTVATDVDIRNIMVPPTTGRYSYASDRSKQAGKLNVTIPPAVRNWVLPAPGSKQQAALDVAGGALAGAQKNPGALGDATRSAVSKVQRVAKPAREVADELFNFRFGSAVQVTPRNKLAAAASEPLGLRLHKLAQGEMMGAGMQGGGDPYGQQPQQPQGQGQGQGGQFAMTQPTPPPGQGQGGQGAQPFDPEVWSTFVEQFQRIQGTTPGAVIDSGTMDLESLAKMYKSHQKTWEIAPEPIQTEGMAPAAPLGMPAPPMDTSQLPPAGGMGGMDQQQGMTTTAAAKTAGGFRGGFNPTQPEKVVYDILGNVDRFSGKPKLRKTIAEEIAAAFAPLTNALKKKSPNSATTKTIKQGTWGSSVDDLTGLMARGAAGGATIGGVRAGMDEDLSDVPAGMLRGAVGGAIGAPLGKAIGGAAGRSRTGNKYIDIDDASDLGAVLGASGGGWIGAKGDKTDYQHMLHPMSHPSHGEQAPYYHQQRTASDHNADILQMIKHARDGKVNYRNVLPEFLRSAPNTVKQAFAQVLVENPRLLKIAGDTYGPNTLIECLERTQEKFAGVSNVGGELIVADKKTSAGDVRHSFGKAAPEAFHGVLMRGYHFKDTRPSLNMAVQTQEHHDFHDPLESGTYFLYPHNKEPKAALVICEPLNLMRDDRPYSPKDHESKVHPIKNRIPRALEHDLEENTIGANATPRAGDDMPDVERSHRYKRLFIHGDGSYCETEHIMGEMVTESALEGTRVFKTVMSDGKAAPRKGKGCFVYKRGSTYVATMPVELANVTTNQDGVVKAKISGLGGTSTKTLVMDPRSPMGNPIRPRGESIVFVPARWKWLPLGKELNCADYVKEPCELTDTLVQAMGSMGVNKAVAVDAGESMFAVDGDRTVDKNAALRKLAEDHYIHASAAEAMLKIASVEGKCEAFIVSPAQKAQLSSLTKNASNLSTIHKVIQAQNDPERLRKFYRGTKKIKKRSGKADSDGFEQMTNTDMAQDYSGDRMLELMDKGGSAQKTAAPGEPMPMAPTPQDPMAGPQGPPPEMPPAMQSDPAMQGSMVEQAFQETLQGLEQQIGELMAQVQVLQSVQQRAMELEGGGGEMQGGMDPAMQGGGQMPQDPAMGGGQMQGGMDPAMQGGMDPAMQGDPAMQQEEPPPPPIMRTEQPSSQEIESQINPEFLEQAGQFQQQGAFDAGALGSLAQSPSLKDMSSQYAANLEDSVDDLGRTLLTLYMQERELKDQLGDEAFTKLETQLRDTFKGLGDLTLNLSQNSSQIDNSAQA